MVAAVVGWILKGTTRELQALLVLRGHTEHVKRSYLRPGKLTLKGQRGSSGAHEGCDSVLYQPVENVAKHLMEHSRVLSL